MDSIRVLDGIDEKEFEPMLQYLRKHPVQKTKYRTKVGEGRSQTYGIVGRRCLAPAISRTTCNNSEFFSLLMDFATRFVPVSFSSIQVNQVYVCKPHKDIHNIGQSYIIAFGSYIGGELMIHGDKAYDIRHRPLLFDGSKLLHSNLPFEGERISLVFHTIAPSSRFPMIQSLSEYETYEENGVCKIKHLPTGGVFYKNCTPDHYLKGVKRCAKKETSDSE